MARFLVTVGQPSVQINVAGAPTSEALVLAVLLVLVASGLFAAIIAGPTQPWDGESDAGTTETKTST
jgi:hypothetical protein